MGKDSSISWTHHTFSGWWGCIEVSPACDHCYARTLSHRWGFDVWGKDKPRRFFGQKHWNEPLKWDAAAAKAGERHRVFSASMSDVFESRDDLDLQREKLWTLISKTPNLDWMLLTKRPENLKKMLPYDWQVKPRKNVWLGVTAENQRRADERIPELLAVDAAVHWISAEPLLGPIDFKKYWSSEKETSERSYDVVPGIDWVIVGGESGNSPRRMDPDWVRDIRKQCREAGTKFHFKQKGRILAAEMGCKDREGKDSSEWPAEFQIQEFPTTAV